MNKAIIFGLALTAPLALAGKPSVDYNVVKSAGKVVAPIHLTHNALHEVAVGDRVAVNLPLVLEHDANGVRVEVHADDGLALSQPWLKFDLGPQPSGALNLPAINVTVMQEGRRYLNANVYVATPRGEMYRSFSVPLSTPGAKESASNRAGLKTDLTGRKLRIMRATQTSER